ncbi:MAG: protein BatD [Paludibacteraceae bacterium]|nr:protein BatD [Paludibacteraceae bacterium]
MKRLSIIFFAMCLYSILGIGMLRAEDVQFRAQAPAQVIVGRPFQFTYTVNQRARDLRAPEFNNFDYIAGPYTSQSSSTSFVNGRRTSSFTMTFTYTLMAQKEGTFSIPPATINVGGEHYTSNGVKITVLPEDQPQQTGSGQQPTASNQRSATGGQQSATNGPEQGNIFVRTLVSKTKVYEQEAVLLSYKVYVAGVDLKQFTNNTTLPDFTSFLQQKIDLQDVQLELENYNGRNYQTATIYSTLLYPQKSGDITIEPATFEAVLLVPNQARSRSIFDDFFNSYTTATRSLRAPGTTIHVTPLPAGKPVSYAGGVGKFTMDAKLSATDVKANEAITLTLTIRGAGNMKLLKTPSVDWPEGFEQYDPKVTNNFKTSTGGMSGTRTIEYLAIPRAPGDYILPPVQFGYFDTEKGQYQVLTTPEYTLHIARGAGDQSATGVQQSTVSYVNKEDIRELGSDIRYISAANFAPSSEKEVLRIGFGSWQMWLLYGCPLTLALLLFVIFRKRIRENADLTRVRKRQANSVARKRLKQAKKLMGEAQHKEQFFEEIERASLQYLSDRLSIPTADLNKDTITATLRSKAIDESLIERTNNVLSDAAFARYAPAMGITPEQLYKQTESLINDLEDCKL